MKIRNGSRFLWGKGIAVAKWEKWPPPTMPENPVSVGAFLSTYLHPLEGLKIPKAKEGSA